MQLSNAARICGEQNRGWRIHFEHHTKGRWVPDFFPGGNQDPFYSEAEASRWLQSFIARCGRAFRDIRLVENIAPLRDFDGSAVFAYCRVSLDKQDPDCLRQKDAVEPWIKETLMTKGAHWTGEYFVDLGVSATIDFLSRPAGYELNRRLRAGDHVVVAELDRAFRSPKDGYRTIDAWHEQGVFFHSLDLPMDLSQFMGRALFGIRMIFADMEKRMTGNRTRETMRARKLAGKPVNGKLPFGKKWSHRGKSRLMITDPEELRLLRQMILWHDSGYSTRDISRVLMQQKVKRHDGTTEWNQSQVYRGMRYYRGLEKRNDPCLDCLKQFDGQPALGGVVPDRSDA
jgi:DNA invertase Pin-like site-specific DNA recombinase